MPDIPDGPDPNWILGSETDEQFFESHLATGTDSDSAALCKTLDLPAGFTPNLEGWSEAGGVHELEGAYGKLTWDGNGLRYTTIGWRIFYETALPEAYIEAGRVKKRRRPLSALGIFQGPLCLLANGLARSTFPRQALD